MRTNYNQKIEQYFEYLRAFFKDNNLNMSIEHYTGHVLPGARLVNNDTKKYNVVVPFGFGCIRGLVPVEQGDEIYIHIAHLSNLADAKIHHLKGKI